MKTGYFADVSQFAITIIIIIDERKKRKFAIISKAMLPELALIDPETTITMSPELTASTGMDALSHVSYNWIHPTQENTRVQSLALRSRKSLSNSTAEAYGLKVNPVKGVFLLLRCLRVSSSACEM